MPFIRDYAFSTTGATAAITITCGTPVTQQNDLLIALITSDGQITNTANTTITGAGWFFQGGFGANATNDAGMQIYARYAPASPPVDYTFSGITSETLNATIISIGDVFQSGTADPTTALENKTASTTTPNWTAARQTFPAIATSANDSLILYFGVGDGTAATGVPSVVEGLTNHLIIGKDGGSHCDGVGWAFKRTAGTLATNTNWITIDGTTAPTNFLAQMVVRPPTGGITVRYPYIVQDNCKLICFGTGNANASSYGNITATAANSTDFPTATLTLNGRPVVAGGATFTAADQGVNTFHSGINILGVVTSGSWASNQTTTPAMTDLAGSNLLFHVSPQVPSSLQSVDSALLSGAAGFAIGLASTAGNCKVWHCHGSSTVWENSRWVPVIINTSATAGVIGTAGTFDPASITKIGLFLSCKGVANSLTVVSIWKMADTIAAGGDANRPFGIQDTVKVFATAKERRSVILQGASQLYVSQELQYGNGGTDPTYVKLDNAVFEFPAQYDKSKGLINYNSIDNKVGVSFYPGASDTISLVNVIFTSANKFKWGFNPSSGAAAVNTTGMQVIGAGTITMSANVAMSSCGFNKCDEITGSGTTFNNVEFSNSTATNVQGALSITGATQTALQTELNKITSCSFINNTTPAGALRIIYTGAAGAISLSMSSNTFSGNTKDIRWEAPASSNLTINLTGTADPSTFSATNSNTVTFSNPKTFTINNIITDSEVRIYRASDSVELGGVETVSGTPTGVSGVTVSSDPDNAGRYQVVYSYNYSVDTPINVVIFNVAYQPIFQTATLKSTDSTLLATQSTDRQYARGTTFTPT